MTSDSPSSAEEIAAIEKAASEFETPSIHVKEGQLKALKIIEWGVPRLISYIRTFQNECQYYKDHAQRLDEETEVLKKELEEEKAERDRIWKLYIDMHN